MKINTLTLRNIIKEELTSVMNEFKAHGNSPSPESMGVVLPQKFKDFIDGIDFKKLEDMAKKYLGHRTLEESEEQKRKLQRRRRRTQEIPPEGLQADEPFEEDNRTSEEIITALTKLIKDQDDKLATNTTSPEYQDGLAELISRHEEANDEYEKEFLKKWIDIFQYAARWPLLKKQFPKFSDFIKNRKEEVLGVYKKGKEEVSDLYKKGKNLPSVASDKAKEKWGAMDTYNKGKIVLGSGLGTGATFAAICIYIAQQFPPTSQVGAGIGLVGIMGFIVITMFISLFGIDWLDDKLKKNDENN